MAIEFALTPPTQKILLAPDIDYIKKVANGNLSIADSMKKVTQLKNLATVPDISVLKKYLDLSKVQLPNDTDSYVKNNKLRIPSADLSCIASEDFNGFKALEITTVKAIFETQKPYMEIIALMTKSLVDIEDLIARALLIPFIPTGAPPMKSLKPATNPKALGYQYKDMKKNLNILKNFNNKSRQQTGTKNTNPFDTDFTQPSNTPPTPEGNGSITYEILGTEYSTGVFEKNIHYDYIYHDIEESHIVEDDAVPDSLDNVPKPNIIAFSIVDSTGLPITVPDWLLNSGKWFGQFPLIGDFVYIWSRDDGATVPSLGMPDPLTYGYGWTNTEKQIFNQGDQDYYRSYYNYLIDFKLNNRPLISDPDKNDIRTKVSNKIDINAQLNGVSAGGYASSFNPKLFSKQNLPLLPKKIIYENNDPYVDPETEYDLKFIKVDSTLDIAFFENTGVELQTVIQRFLFNTYKLKFNDDSLFDIKFIIADFGPSAGLSSSNITSNTSELLNTADIILDNLTNNFLYKVEIIKRTVPGFFKPIFWSDPNKFSLNFPNFDTVQVPQPPAATQSGTSSGTHSTPPNPPAAPTETFTFNYVFKDTSGDWKFNILNLQTNDSIQSSQINKIPLGDPAADGTYDIPNNFGKIVVRNGKIYGWLFNKDIIISNMQNKAGTINSQNLVLNESTVPLEYGSIRVLSDDDRFGKIINSNQIKNEQLQISTAYSQQDYGTPEIQQLFRYRTSLDDTATYYILEGKIQGEDNPATQGATASGGGNNNGSSNSGVSKSYYRKPHAIGAAKKFVDVYIIILTDLIPAIKTLIDLIKSPTNFITDILKQKLGENFELFSPEIISKFQSLASMDPKQRASFVESNTDLKKYVSVTGIGDYLYILDGQAIMQFLDIRFGLELKKLKISLIFESLKQLGGQNNSSNSNSANSGNAPGGNLANTTGNVVGDEIITHQIQNGDTVTEEVSIIYSTGKKIDNIDYDYIYVSETVLNLVAEYEDALGRKDYDSALNSLIQAVGLDPGNEALRQKLADLRKLASLFLQPILNFLLNLVSMPIKMVFEIIKYIMGVFDSISIDTVVQTFTDFITFKWLLKFTSKDFILGLLGITLDFGKLAEWKNWKTFPKEQMFDLSQIFACPFFFKLPTVPRDFLQYMLPQICEIINALLKLLEGIINGVIDFIWALISLDAIIPQPHVHLTRPCSSPNNSSITAEQLFDLLNNTNGTGNGDDNTTGLTPSSALDQFVFDIKESNGISLRSLNREQLQDFIDANPNFDFKFDF